MSVDVKMVDENTLIARPYQDQIFELAKKENVIIYLPTGAGKTYIALMLMKYMAHDLTISLKEGGKRTIFVVNTVVLAHQQKEFVEKQTSLKADVYTREKNVDDWKKDKWREEFEKNQVIVATAETILNVLRHKFLTLKEINLIIFDECHNAIGKHPMHELMVQFEGIPKRDQPRVLGLTGTLLASKIKAHSVEQNIKKLENTFQAVIRTVNSTEEFVNVLSYSTNPVESMIQYASLPPNNDIMEIKEMVNNYMTMIENWPLENISYLEMLLNLFNDFLIQMDATGIYGASVAILSVIIELELKKRSAETSSHKHLLRALITGGNLIAKMLDLKMSDQKTHFERATHYGSPKLKQLIVFLEEYVAKNGAEDLKCLVFVQRRYTAKCLYHILKKVYGDKNPRFDIRPDFMVGGNSRIPESIEYILEAKWQRRVISKFKKGETNLIVASSVLEEGIDLQMCNVVISFDCPLNFRSYLQSKGRARLKNSHYVLMVAAEDSQKMGEKITEYKEIDRILKKVLLDKVVDRNLPLEEDIEKELYKHDIQPFYTKVLGAKLEATSAIALLNRYCMGLARDVYTQPSVHWKKEVLVDVKKFILHLMLPIQSVCKDVFVSPPSPSLMQAKRHAAFMACRRLYEMGELSENLLPVTSEHLITQEHDVIFAHWADFSADETGVAGTKKNYRFHKINYPNQLNNVCPKVTKVAYLYIINVQPAELSMENREFKDEGNKIFVDLLCEPRNFALMTMKQLPRLPSLKLFLSSAHVNVEISTEPTQVKLEREHDLELLRNFHITVFRDVLQIQKDFLVFDKENRANSYLIVPTSNHLIDWDLVKNFQCLPKIPDLNERDVNERKKMKFQDTDYHHNVVAPWYRGAADHGPRYIVLNVIDMTPKSKFPNSTFVDYADYYRKKYGQTVVNDNQFLIDVKPMTSDLNRLHPITESAQSKRSTKEVLVPELCHNFKFPGSLWLKALLLPSTLHRLHFMLHAENLRQSINEHVGILNDGTYIPQPLDIDNTKVILVSDEKYHKTNTLLLPIPEKTELQKFPINECKSLNEIFSCPWNEQVEPLDLQRYWESVHPHEIDYYCRFIHQDFGILEINTRGGNGGSDAGPSGLCNSQTNLAICAVTDEERSKLKLLDKTALVSPQLKNLIKAITTTSSCDVFSLEKFELLGDSFLKIAVSIYLYQHHPDWHEGHLTTFRGQMVSNRNLLYCGIKKDIPGIMKVSPFIPKDKWQPPLLTLPHFIREKMVENELPCNSLSRLKFDRHEINTGYENMDKIYNFFELFLYGNDCKEDYSQLNNFLHRQSISDKSISDSVEAILGVCVDSFGIEHSLKMLHFFGIIPKVEEIHDIFSSNYIKKPFVKDSVAQREIDQHLTNFYQIENSSGYKFRDRSYLLQALTHASYVSNRVTACYQQLEFLGDAVLDFLVTAYIFEKCPDLDPGKLTDLRSALVNNSTLACIAVRNNFHKFLLYQNATLNEKIGIFVKFQEMNNHVVSEQVFQLIDESDLNLASFVGVPKPLGDVFESIVGAVFLDSGKSLKITWNVIYKLMNVEIHKFMVDVPLQVVRKLFEHPIANPKFMDPIIVEDGTVMVDVRFTVSDQILLATGHGQNSKDAKKAAAKLALNKLNQ